MLVFFYIHKAWFFFCFILVEVTACTSNVSIEHFFRRPSRSESRRKYHRPGDKDYWYRSELAFSFLRRHGRIDSRNAPISQAKIEAGLLVGAPGNRSPGKHYGTGDRGGTGETAADVESGEGAWHERPSHYRRSYRCGRAFPAIPPTELDPEHRAILDMCVQGSG